MPVAGLVTVTAQVALLLPAFAVMVALPLPTAVTVPLDTVAIAVLEEVQTTLSVLSLGVTVAVNVDFSPFFRLRLVLESVMAVAGFEAVTVNET